MAAGLGNILNNLGTFFTNQAFQFFLQTLRGFLLSTEWNGTSTIKLLTHKIKNGLESASSYRLLKTQVVKTSDLLTRLSIFYCSLEGNE